MRGRNLHRLKDNPCERAFAEAFSAMVHRDPSIIAHICGQEFVENKTRETDCASIIQWLGSPVGQYFIIGVLEKQGIVKQV